MTRKDFIASQIVLGLPRDKIITSTMKAFETDDRDRISNHVGVTFFELRKEGILPPIEKSEKPSRHSIIKKGLYKDRSNRSILRSLKRKYPEISEKIHKQRIAEYRWSYNHGIL